MMSIKRSFLRDLVSVGVAKFVTLFSGLGMAVVTARFLSPAENGQIALLLAIPSLFMVFGALGIRQATTFLVARNEFDFEKIHTAVSKLWLFTSVIGVIASGLILLQFSNSIDSIYNVLLAITAIPFSLHNSYCAGVFLGKNDIQGFSRINWLPGFASLLAAFALLYATSLKVDGVMIAYLLGHLTIFVALLWSKRNLSFFPRGKSFETIRQLVRLGFIYALALLVVNLNYKIDLVLLDILSTPSELGIYSKGASIVQYLWHVPMLFGTIIFARSASASNAHDFSRRVASLLRIVLVLVCAFALVMFCLARPLMELLFGQPFAASSQILQILLPGVVLLTMFKVLNMDLAGKGKPWISLKSMVLPVIINVVLNLLWIPPYGGVGAAYASLISYSLGAFLFLYFYSVEAKLTLTEIICYRITDMQLLTRLISAKTGKKQV